MKSNTFALRQRHVCSFRNWVLFQENERLTCLKSYFVTSIQITIHNAQIGYILLIRSVQIEFCTNSIKFEKKNNEWMMPITLYTNFSVCANSIQTKQPHRVERHISFVLGNLLLYMTHRYFFLTLNDQFVAKQFRMVSFGNFFFSLVSGHFIMSHVICTNLEGCLRYLSCDLP